MTPPRPERHILGPVTLETSLGPVEYSVELSVGELDTDSTHSVIMMMAILRGPTTIATLHHLDQVIIKDIDTEVEETSDE